MQAATTLNCLHCNGKGTVNKFIRPHGTNRDGEYRDYPCPFCDPTIRVDVDFDPTIERERHWFDLLTDEQLTELYGVPTKRIKSFTVTVEPHGEMV